MPEEHAPDDIDWVAAQSTCNAASMFARLQAGVKEDVQRRNGLSGRDDGWTFELHEDGAEFEVSRLVAWGGTDSTVAALVRFERAGRRIEVHGDRVDVDFTAVVALDGAGVCRFVVGEAIYSEWEIRRMALEQLFFDDEEEDEEAISRE
jgi:hypothetical protein